MNYSYLSVFRFILIAAAVFTMITGWTVEVGEINESDGQIYAINLANFVFFAFIGLAGVGLAEFIKLSQKVEQHPQDIRYVLRKQYHFENTQSKKPADTKESSEQRYKFRY